MRILVEDELVRAVKRRNRLYEMRQRYAASILGQVKAEEQGCTQVLWLDGVERKYVEEVGTMNIMFKINGEILYSADRGDRSSRRYERFDYSYPERLGI